MLKLLKVWWVLLTRVGPVARVGRQADQWIRYYILETLAREGLFDYLAKPRNYGQIIARFGYVDQPYTREVFETLARGRDNVLTEDDGRYYRNPAVPLPDREDLIRRTAERLHQLSFVQDFAQQVPARLRQEPLDFVRRFEEEGPALFSFDKSLSTRIYAGLREAAFAFVDKEELRGKRLLDVGCGSGHETADIWLRLGGDVEITAIDPASGLLKLADEQFTTIVSGHDQLNGKRLTADNRPTFHLMSAMNLEFPDNSFDVIYHSLVLHWLSSPEHGVREIARVLKPGGLVFGAQYTKPTASSWQNVLFRVHEGVHGTFWEEEFRQWYRQAGVSLEIATPAGIFRGRRLHSQVASAL